ncbi:hypothetical protein GCM10027299_42100 [Larkinella ripae]
MGNPCNGSGAGKEANDDSADCRINRLTSSLFRIKHNGSSISHFFQCPFKVIQTSNLGMGHFGDNQKKFGD